MGRTWLEASKIAAEHGRGAGRDVATVQTGSARRDEAFPRLHGIAGSATDLVANLSPEGIGAVDISSTGRWHHPQVLAGIGAVAGTGVFPDFLLHRVGVAGFLPDEDPPSGAARTASTGRGRTGEDGVMSVRAMPAGVIVAAREAHRHPFAVSGRDVHGAGGPIFASGGMTRQRVGEVAPVAGAGRPAVACTARDLHCRAVHDFRSAEAGRGRPAADRRDGVASPTVVRAMREAAKSGPRRMVQSGAAA